MAEPLATFKTGDTYPSLQLTLDDDGTPVDLTNADSVRLILKLDATVVEGTMTVTTAASGEVEYDWEADDLAVEGDYEGEVEVTWDSGSTPPSVQTFPNDGYFTISVVADLD